MASGVKVFYSWQSDLPNNATRGFLQECIDAAIKHLKHTVVVEVDRDTNVIKQRSLPYIEYGRLVLC